MHERKAPARRGLDLVAVLERIIHASLERIWENVLDWEHLPWLHSSSFASVDLEDSGTWGWRARATSTAQPDDPFVIEVQIDREAGRYVSRTLHGTASGTEIWTRLDPCAEHETRIRVEFWLPGVPEAAHDKVGAGYRRLYERLWDEDEAMMRERTAQLRPRTPTINANSQRRVDLGPRDSLENELPRCVEVGGAVWRVVLLDGEFVVHDALCPHRLGPLTKGSDSDPAGGEIECPWHGYRFDVRTGRSSDGRRLRLRHPPRIQHDPETDHVALILD